MNDITVLYAGKQKYDQGIGFAPHSHSHWELFYFSGGARRVEIDHTAHCTEEYGWVVIKPDMTHAIPAARSELDLYIIKFEVLNKSLYQMLMALPEVIAQDDKSILALVKKMASEERRASQYSSYISNALLEYLLFEYIRHVRHEIDHQIAFDVPVPLGESFQNEIVNLIIRYIKLNFQHDISIKDIAGGIGYSESYCCTVFKTVTGHTIMDYLNMQRIYSAEELIVQNTELTLTQVAEQVGYKNFSHFSKVFKQIMNTTPSYVRKMAKKELYEDTKRIGYSPWLYDDK